MQKRLQVQILQPLFLHEKARYDCRAFFEENRKTNSLVLYAY